MKLDPESQKAIDELPEQYREKAARTLLNFKENAVAVPLIDTYAMQTYLETFMSAFFTVMGPELKEESRKFCEDLISAVNKVQEERKAPNGVVLSAIIGIALSTVTRHNMQLARRYDAEQAAAGG